MQPPFTHRQLSLAGGLHRVTEFPGRGPGICALHGFTGSGQDFELLAQHLDRSMTAPDLHGHGPLATGEEVSMEEECARLAELVEDIPARPVLLGYSLGARTALNWALNSQTSFAALVLIGGSPGLEDVEARRQREDSDRKLAERILSDGVSPFADYWEALPIISSQRSIRAPFGEALRARRRSNVAEGLAASLRGMGTGAQVSHWHRLSDLQLPTLLITGADDTKFEHIADQMAEEIPSCQHLSVGRAGHCTHLEQPEITAQGINDFLASIDC